MRENPLLIRDSTIFERIKDRQSVFLDINVWIDLADEKSDIAKRVRRLLMDLANSGAIFCPLSEVVLWELYKQGFDSMLRVGELMEKLSLNISFATKEEIFENEIKRFISNFIEKRSEDLQEEDLFVPVVAYLSSYGKLVFPDSWAEDEIEEFIILFMNTLTSLKLTDFLKMRKNELAFIKKKRDPGYNNVWRNRWLAAQGNKKKIHRFEEEAIALKTILPRINKISSRLPIELQLRFIAYLKSLPRDKYGGSLEFMLSQMPALKNEVDILTVSGFDFNRRTTMNDFFDIELLAVPLAYANVFASQDKWMKHLLTNMKHWIAESRCKFVYGFGELEKYLMSSILKES